MNKKPRVLRIGDTVTRHPHIGTVDDRGRPVKSGCIGTVEYIHSRGMFHAVRFKFWEYFYLECFKGNQVNEIC